MEISFTQLFSERIGRRRYSLLVLLALLLWFVFLSGGVYGQTISTISPTCATLNQGFTLTINGSNFTTGNNGTAVAINGDFDNFLTPSTRTTSQLIVDVQASLVNKVGSITVQVANRSGNSYSNWSDPVPFTVLTTPNVTPATRCGTGQVNLSASGTPTGGSYNWYTAASGETLLHSGTTYSPTVSTTTTYYVSMTSGGCESARAAVTATVNPIPNAPTTTSADRCGPGSVTLMASGAATDASYRWYTDASGGTPISEATGSSYTTPNLSSTAAYYVSIVSNAGCESSRTPVTATINPVPAAPTTTSSQICRGGVVNLSAAGTLTGGDYRWYTAATGGTLLATGANYSPNVSTTTDYYVATVGAEGCESATRTQVTAKVIDVPVASVKTGGNPTTFCEGGSIVLTAAANPASSTYTYQWKKDGASITGATAETYTASTTGNYSVIVSNEGCPSDESAPVAVTVHPYPVATISAPNGPVICQGGTVALRVEPVAGGIYQWQLNGNNIAGATANTFNADASGDYRVIVTQNNCPTISEVITVTIFTPPTASITGQSAFCDGATTVLTANTDKGTSYEWLKDGGVISGQAGNTLTISEGGSYQVRVTDGNECFTTSASFSVTKKPLPIAVITPASSLEFCNGGSVVLNASTATGNSYRWFKDGGSTPVSTSASYTAITAGSYTVEVSNNSCTQLSGAVDVVVNPNPVATITPTGPTSFCEGNSVVLNAPAAPAGQVYSYQWFKDGGTAAVGTGQSLEVNESGSYTLRVTSGKGCAVTSAALVVKVQTQAAATITYTGAIEFCEGGTIVFMAPQAPSGQQYTYQWLEGGSPISNATGPSFTATASGNYSVTVSNVEDDPDLVCSKTSDAVSVNVLPQPVTNITSGSEAKCIGANNTTTFTIAGDYAGGTPQWVSSSADFVIQNPSYSNGKATATVLVTGEGAATISLQTSNATASCNTASSSVTLTVDPLPETTITAASATTFCQGGSVVLSAPEGPYSYQWLRNGAAVAGTERQFTATTDGDYTVRVTNTTTGCVATTQTATSITVNPQPTVTAASASQASQCVGANNTTVFDLTGAVANGSPSWSFVSSTGTASVGSFSSPNTGNTQVTVSGIGTVTVRLTSSSDVASCNDAAREITLTVNPYPTADAGPDQELCVGNGRITTFNRQGSGSGNDNNQEAKWEIVSTDGIDRDSINVAYPWLYENFVRITGIGTVVLKLTVTVNGCSTSDEVVYTVKPKPSVEEVANKTYCNGASGSAINFGSSLEGSTYAWTSSRDIGFGTSGSGNIPAFTAENTGTAPVAATVRVTATNDECPGVTQTFTITVNPSPKLRSSLTPAAVCSGSAFTYTPTSATADAAFAWTRTAVTGISNAAASGTGAVNEILINTTPDPIKVIYVYTITANDCSGEPQNVEVIVNPRPVLSSTLTPDAICSGTAFSYTPTSATTGATFSWSRIAVAGINNGSGATGTGAINQALTNSTTEPINVTYRITTKANGCEGSSTEDVVVTVNPSPVLSSTLTPDAICSGTTFSYTPASTTAGATFFWTRLPATGITGGDDTGTGAINQALTNTTANPVNVTYKFTTTANGCSGTTQDVIVKVNPTPRLTSTLTPAAVCSETPFSYTPTSATGGATFSWTRAEVTGISNPAVTTPFTGGISETLVNTTTTDKTVTYVYTISANGCTNTQSVDVVVKPKPDPTFNLTEGQIFFSGDNNITLTGSPAGGTFSSPGVTGSTFSPCNAFKNAPAGATEMKVAITYSVTVNGCTSIVTRNVKIKKSIYQVVVIADPHPFCQGEIVNYKSYVYRDAEIVYPYLVNEKGQPVDENGNLIPKGAGSFPVWNPEYPFPEGTPQLVKEQGYRYFQPIVVSGTPLSNDLFNYQWTKNEAVNRKNDNWETKDAGLSSQDYYGVKVTSKDGAICDDVLKDLMSYRVYSADLPNYNVNLAVSPILMCQSGPVTLTATLDGDFDYWEMADLNLEFILTRGSTTYTLNTLPYNGSNTIEFTYDPATTSLGSFIDGDKIHINFTSVVDEFLGTSKCAGKTVSNEITIVVEEPAEVTTDLTDTPIVKCEGESASFSVSGTGTGLQFNWFKDDATPVTADGRITIVNTTANDITTSTLTITDLLESDAGMYYADLANTNTFACKTTATTTKQQLVVNPVAEAQTMLGGEYCPYNADGVNLTLDGSEVGINYELLKDGQPLVPAVVMAGTGSALNFGTFTEGNYSITGAGVDNGYGTCPNTSVATATITSRLVAEEVTGDLEFEWVAADTWKFTAKESGLPDESYSFGAAPEFVWFTKPIAAGEEAWEEIVRTEENTLILKDTPPDTEVKAEVYAYDKCQMFTMITGAVVPFPVELIEFKAKKQGNDAVLSWSTAMEQENTGFEVQVSEDGMQYRKLEFVPTLNGNSSRKQTYTFVDKEKNKRLTRYYRLKQIDADGTSELFGPVSVNFGEFKESIVAYPNPFPDNIYLDIETDTAGPMEVVMTDVTGKRLLSRIIEVEQGKGTYIIELERATPTGAYFITTRKGDQIKHFKLIKQ